LSIAASRDGRHRLIGVPSHDRRRDDHVLLRDPEGAGGRGVVADVGPRRLPGGRVGGALQRLLVVVPLLDERLDLELACDASGDLADDVAAQPRRLPEIGACTFIQ
jgi:hypothetical protein